MGDLETPLNRASSWLAASSLTFDGRALCRLIVSTLGSEWRHGCRPGSMSGGAPRPTPQRRTCRSPAATSVWPNALTGSGGLRSGWGPAGTRLCRPGARHRRRACGEPTSTRCATARRIRLGRPRPFPAVDRPLRHRALRSADRGRGAAGRRARDLRHRRQPHADVGHARPTRPAWRSPAARSAMVWASRSACALGLKRKKNPAFVYNLLSDGELGEGSTWEAAMVGRRTIQLDNLDRNRRLQQPAGGRSAQDCSCLPSLVTAKFEAFGWHAQRVDGNDIECRTQPRSTSPAPLPNQGRASSSATPCMAKGVPFLEAREMTHFIRVEPRRNGRLR